MTPGNVLSREFHVMGKSNLWLHREILKGTSTIGYSHFVEKRTQFSTFCV